MPEKRTEVKVYKVRMMCDRCKQGEMKQTPMMYPLFPGQYEHQCDCCGYRTSYSIQYPTIAYEEVAEEEERGESDDSIKERAEKEDKQEG